MATMKENTELKCIIEWYLAKNKSLKKRIKKFKKKLNNFNLDNDEIVKIVSEAFIELNEADSIREATKKAFIEHYTNIGDIEALEAFKKKHKKLEGI